MKKEEKCIGTGSLFIDKDTAFDHITGYIEDIIVCEENYDSSGLLLSAIIDLAWYQGCDRCQVNCSSSRHGLELSKFGFEVQDQSRADDST
jgi:hypothetical protein